MIKDKLKSPPKTGNYCSTEESALLACLKEKCDSPLECDIVAQTFMKCAASLLSK